MRTDQLGFAMSRGEENFAAPVMNVKLSGFAFQDWALETEGSPTPCQGLAFCIANSGEFNNAPVRQSIHGERQIGPQASHCAQNWRQG
jgi:hypothetical protein